MAEYAADPDLLEQHLSRARAEDTQARNTVHRAEYAKGNALLFMVGGGALLIVWAVWTALSARGKAR